MPFLATLFFFILISNFVGLIPGCKTPTGTISVTWALATISFIYFNVWGIKAKGGLGYLKSFAPAGLPKVMVPIIWFLELISTCIRWLTLAVRLYGNMFAGHMVLGIFALASSVFLTCGIQALDPLTGVLSLPWFLLLIAMYALETLVAFLQAYVFTVLSRSTSRSPRAPTRNRSRAPTPRRAPGAAKAHPPIWVKRLLQSRKP